MTEKVVLVYFVDGSIHCDDADKVYSLSREDCWEIGLQLAYLITVHKSQGNEYDICLIRMDSPYLERSGIYTALTRTKNSIQWLALTNNTTALSGDGLHTRLFAVDFLLYSKIFNNYLLPTTL
jgi:ATP-dependent exoDNAse (exonuclease V) alpha subunit